MSSSVDDELSVWQEREIIPSDLPESYDGFCVLVRVYITLQRPNHTITWQLNSYTRLYLITRPQFLNKETMKNLLLDHVYVAALPEHMKETIINRVVNLGLSMMSDRRALPIVVEVRRRILQQSAIDHAIRESTEVSEFRPVPATESSIQSLEKTKLDDDSCSGNQCAICLEKILVGSEIIRMPCSHIYHGDCIVQCSVHQEFSVRQDNEIIPSNLPESYDGVFVLIKVFNTLQRQNHTVTRLNSFSRLFPMARHQFDNKEAMEIVLLRHLCIACLPEDIEEAIVDLVFILGLLMMMSDARNGHRKVLPIVVEVRTRIILQPSAVDIAIRESMEVSEFRPVPATKSSIQALEKTTLDDDSCSLTQCAICLEKFSVGLEIIRMPCSHIYHGDCIVQWLETSHLCPLCRFPMPREIIS
ncbi:hypothetical protein F0562_013890 [Nyssa sinensis]|uniref:RING-type domain-containing protein n=1 Tax=Nyssa sinensis TaxID=561372 RepID=A0A5J4ZM18_9ASTE|nr:hypothetical protein F0562_013890 [Nyssa sinensis]